MFRAAMRGKFRRAACSHMCSRPLVSSSRARFAQSYVIMKVGCDRPGALPHDSITSKSKREEDSRLHSHYLIPAIDIDHLAGYCRGSIAGKKDSGGA
jgi:hypothetical protein